MFEAILAFAHYLLFFDFLFVHFHTKPMAFPFISVHLVAFCVCVCLSFLSWRPAYHQMQSVKIHNLWLCVCFVLLSIYYSVWIWFLCVWFPISFTFHVEHFAILFSFGRSSVHFFSISFVRFCFLFVFFSTWIISCRLSFCVFMWM